ncbi:MAG: FAD-binding oxidoreductase [Candidatus Bathyarchaeia archaeon]
MGKADVVVVGGGVVGLSTAYNLAKRDVKKVAVLERRYVGSGASTRNACGITDQLGAKENIALAKESKKIYENLSKELSFNILYVRGGGLIIATTEREARILRDNVATQNSLGVNSRLLTPGEVRELVPCINGEAVINASYDPTDCKAHHDAVVWAYERAAKRLGVEINTYTEVKAIEVEGGKVRSVITDRGDVETEVVVNAAGMFSSDVAKMAGIELPIKLRRVEAMVTESLKYFLDPRILSLNEHLFLTQTLRGELMGGMAVDEKLHDVTLQSSLSFLEAFSKKIVKLIPRMQFLNMIRQWVGYFDVTPDGSPIIGPVDEVEGFVQANGFNGYGFTLAPIIGKLVAEWITTGKTSIPIEPYNLNRFKEDRLLPENTVFH